MSLYTLIITPLSLLYLLYLYYVKYIATNLFIKCKFNKKSSNKYTYYYI